MTPPLFSSQTLWRWTFPLVCLGLALEVALTCTNLPLFEALHRLFSFLPPLMWTHWTALGDSALLPLLLFPWWRRRPDLLWAALLASLLAFLFSHGLKHWIDAPRPPAVLTVTVIGPRLLQGSFPSGHTTAIFTLVALLIHGLPLRTPGLRWTLIFMGLAVGASRIALGVHWPLDVLVGAAGGWLCALAGLAWAQRWTWGTTRGRWLPLLMLVMLAAFALFRGSEGLPGVFWSEKAFALTMLILGGRAGFHPSPPSPAKTLD